MDAWRSYLPGGILRMKNDPSIPELAPSVVPTITILALMRGSPVVPSVIVPEIFPEL
jgi:hypothetical protein